MKFKQPVYYCQHCKKTAASLDDLLFVEENVPAGFCSEECIEAFYVPLVGHFAATEESVRSERGLEGEHCQKYANSSQYLDKIFARPDEIWCLENELGQKLYSFIAHFRGKKEGAFSMVVLCLVYAHRPSFVFLATATQNGALLDEFRLGKKIENLSEFLQQAPADKDKIKDPSQDIDQELVALLEHKKSLLLARLLAQRPATDIPYESFPLYDIFHRPTLETPDEVYRERDSEGDDIYTYIKGLENNGTAFFYFVICMKGKKGNDAAVDMLYPILSFPSLDGELYRSFKKGSLVSGIIKN